jgi:hypothetical protein
MITYKTQIEPNKPRNKKEFLCAAIGKKITEIERFFVTTPEEFIEDNSNVHSKDKYFSLCHGASQFWLGASQSCKSSQKSSFPLR